MKDTTIQQTLLDAARRAVAALEYEQACRPMHLRSEAVGEWEVTESLRAAISMAEVNEIRQDAQRMAELSAMHRVHMEVSK